MFCCRSKRDTQDVWFLTKWFRVFAQNFKFSVYSKVIHGTTAFKLRKGQKKLMNYPNLIFFIFFHFLHSNVPDIKCHKQMWCVLFFTSLKLVASVLACINQMKKTVHKSQVPTKLRSFRPPLEFRYPLRKIFDSPLLLLAPLNKNSRYQNNEKQVT